jgi:hypothetical protein
VVVPSLQVVVAPEADAAGAAGAAAAGAAGAACVAAAAFWTPPWPLQVPLPVDVVVVPSLQVVSAKLGIAIAKANRGAATKLATVIFFMKCSLPGLITEEPIVNPFPEVALAAQGLGFMGTTLKTLMTNCVCWPSATPW